MSGNLFSIVNLDLNYSGTHRQWAFRHNNNYNNNIHTYYVHWNINNQHVARARARENERDRYYICIGSTHIFI